jgi:hypothetical protein
MALEDYAAVMPRQDDDEEQRRRAMLAAKPPQPMLGPNGEPPPQFAPVKPQNMEAPPVQHAPYAPAIGPVAPAASEEQNHFRTNLIVNGMAPAEATAKASGYAPVQQNSNAATPPSLQDKSASAFPPVQPMNAGLPVGPTAQTPPTFAAVKPQNMEAPEIKQPAQPFAPVLPMTAPARPDLRADIMAGKVAPPMSSDYTAVKPSRGATILNRISAGMVGFKNPEAGIQVRREFEEAPRREAAANLAHDTSEYNTVLSQGLQQRNATGEEKLRGAETDLARERINQLKQKPEDKFLYHDQDDSGNAIAVFQGQNGLYTKSLGYQVGGKPKAHTNPFEAFAYGDANERKAAQDFITFEKKLGQRFEKPGEVEQRYTLFKRDPEAYKAMFGDRGATQDNAQTSRNQAQATRMLNYFAKQRKQVEEDFTLDDAAKQQQLTDIEELEKPFKEIALPIGAGGAIAKPGGGNGPRTDEVEVINPNGQHGYIPRANLQKALGRGYKQASQ